MLEKFATACLLDGGMLLVLAALFLFPLAARAQLFANPVPTDQQRLSPLTDGSGLGISADSSADTNDPRTSADGLANALSSAGAINPEQEQILIDRYRREAGKLGPRKLVSAYKLTLRAGVSVAYDDNILVARPGEERSDVITTLTGGGTLLLGDYLNRDHNFLVLNYVARGEIFAENSDQTALNHDASLLVHYRPHDVLVQFASAYLLTHDASADVAERVERQLISEGLLVRYYRSDRTTVEAEVDYTHNVYESVSTSDQVSGGLAADYLVASHVKLGAGVVFGNLAATGALDENYQQLQGRFSYTVSHNIELALRGGLEVRETDGAGTRLNPVFSLAGTWTPFDGTALTVEGHRYTEASAANFGNDFVSTGFQLGIRQRLYTRFYASLSAGYENQDYRNVTSEDLTTRNDDYFNLQAAGGYEFVEWMKLECVYLLRNNRSNQSEYTFKTNRIGLQATFAY